jgi:DNA-binding CsgD family transcriptional regulator
VRATATDTENTNAQRTTVAGDVVADVGDVGDVVADVPRPRQGEALLLAGTTAGTSRPVVIEDATGTRFVLVPEARYRALEAAAHCTTTPRAAVVSLTAREQQILQMVADGCPGSVVADRLGLAANTVAQHLVSARRKYGVRSSAAAASLARQQGLLN